jgi:DNA-binding XRE family transcriptional regulator
MTSDQFQKWRAEMCWTQIQAANALDLHKKTISNYECGVTAIPEVVKLATERLAQSAQAA